MFKFFLNDLRLDASEKFVVECKEEYRTLLFLHYMLQAAEMLAKQVGAQALCTGDALSQVSSQTLENMAILDQSTRRPIFRPLISYNKVDIIALSKKMGTHDISVITHNEACSLLAPQHPVVKPLHQYWTDFTLAFKWEEALQERINNAKIITF